jgi:ribosomal protein S18 acetylase RimI-like enzyme
MINDSEIRVLIPPDLLTLTVIHRLAFPQSAITHLGQEATKRYYEWLLTGPHPDAFCVGVERESNLVGFCFGGRFNAATGGFLQKNRSFLIWRVLTHPWLVFNPLFRERLTLGITILHRLHRTQPAKPIPWSELAKPSFGILAIATHPAWQGKGVGKQLIVAAEEKARDSGYRQMHLTVHPGNTQAVHFYEHLGWQRREGKNHWQGLMSKNLVTS